MKNLNNLFKLMLVIAIFTSSAFKNEVKAQTQSYIEEISFSEWVPCANDGNGELVTGSLVLHTLIQLDKDLRFKKLHFQPQYSELEGQVTGEKYQAHGAENFIFDINNKGARSVSFISMYHIVGKSANFMVKATAHLTINANGEISSDIDMEKMDCK